MAANNMTSKTAIVGLDAIIADVHNIDRFEQQLYNEVRHCVEFPAERAKVLGLEPQQLPKGNWLITGQGKLDILQMLLVSVSEQVDLRAEDLDLLLIEDCLQATERIQLQDSIRSLTSCVSLSEALQAAESLLQQDSGRSVAVAAMHVLSDNHIDGLAASDVELEAHTIAFDAAMGRYMPGEGAGVVLLQHVDKAGQDGRRMYAFIDAVVEGSNAANTFRTALADAGIRKDQLGYLETTASDQEKIRQREQNGILHFYKQQNSMSCAVGSIKALIGDCQCFNELAALIKTVLCVYHRFIPGNPGWQSPRELEEWQKSIFYIPNDSRHWYVIEDGEHRRYAAVSLVDAHQYGHVIISENSADQLRSNGYLAVMDLRMFLLGGDTLDELQDALRNLDEAIDRSSMHQLARQHYEQFMQTDKNYVVVILGEDKAVVHKEIRLMSKGVSQAFAEGGECKTPKGSYFTARPLARDRQNNENAAGVAFVFPGVGAAYVGLGQNLFHMFPGAYRESSKLDPNIADVLKDEIINPRSLCKLGFHDVKERDLQLRRDLATISECGVGFAYVLTRIFKLLLKVKPDIAFGYSMGEVSMFATADVWEDPMALSRRFSASPTFNHNLTGEMQVLRRHWDLPPAKEGEVEKLWETYTLKGTVEEVTAACNEEEKVYVTIVNTPDSVVIGGDPEACQRVIANLGAHGMAMEIPSVIHSEPAFKEYENMEEIHTLEVKGSVDTRLISSSCYLPVPHRAKAIANSIAKCFCEQVDFPRLVNTVYDHGGRIFMEMGAGRSCCSWIDKILKHSDEDKPHVSIPVNAKGTADEITIVRALAKLVSHGVAVELQDFYYGSMIPGKASRKPDLNIVGDQADQAMVV